MRADDDDHVDLCEVGARDGLQSEPRLWSVAERVELIDRLTGAGVTHLEAVSFVNPKRVPQMADAEAVMRRIARPAGVTIAGLALNLRGVERAIEAGVDELRVVVAASETFNQRNQGAAIEETLDAYAASVQRAADAGLRRAGIVSTVFGCPFEGHTAPDRVAHIAKRLADAGAQDIILADTIGAGVPNQVRDVLQVVRHALPDGIRLGCHFHNTRNTGFANASAALDQGVRLFDASVGGIGGCPFAPRATGNIASEDLCHMLRNMGFDVGLDLVQLIQTAQWAEQFFAAPLPGMVMKAGAFPEVVAARSI